MVRPPQSLRDRKRVVPKLKTIDETLHKYQFETTLSAGWKLLQLKRAESAPTKRTKKAYAQVMAELKKVNLKIPIKKRYGIFSFLMNSGQPSITMSFRDKKTKAERTFEITTQEIGLDEIQISVKPKIFKPQ